MSQMVGVCRYARVYGYFTMFPLASHGVHVESHVNPDGSIEMKNQVRSLAASSVFCLAGLLFLGGCGTDNAPMLFSPYLEDKFQPWKGTGDANVSGEAFLRLPSGRVVTCAGETVSLIPATEYNLEMEGVLGAGKGIPANYSKQAHTYDHEAICDARGHFSFTNVPAVKWIVLTRLTWQEPSSIPLMSDDDNGGYLYREVNLAGGENSLSMSNKDFVGDSE